MMEEKKYKVGFVGGGNMAEAICRAVIRSGLFSADEICVYDPLDERQELFRNSLGVKVCRDNGEVVSNSFAGILAVKPQQIAEVLDQIRSDIGNEGFLISIVAGVSTRYIERGLGKDIAVIRTMPNTPLMVGAGVTALCKGSFANDEHLRFAEAIFSSAGEVVRVEEELMDTITAMSGSGPAYFFYLVEGMIQAGLELGLSQDLAHRLSAYTGFGAMKLLMHTQTYPDELRLKVTSPGGTTEAAIEVLEAEDVKRAIVSAIKAAHKRSRQLGQ